MYRKESKGGGRVLIVVRSRISKFIARVSRCNNNLMLTFSEVKSEDVLDRKILLTFTRALARQAE